VFNSDGISPSLQQGLREMKIRISTKPRAWLAGAVGATLLVACGGGGGGDNVAIAPPAQSAPAAFGPAAQPSAPSGNRTSSGAIVVNTVPIPPPTPQDCVRLTSEAQSQAALDLSNPTVRAVHDELRLVDPVHAYKVFVRMPGQFVNWVASMEGALDVDTIGFATHETMHNLSFALGSCSAQKTAQYLLLGSTIDTGLRFGDTANYSIVQETIAPELRSHFRYAEYIPEAATANGNDLRILLDELASYVGGAHTEQLYIASGRAADDRRALEYNLGGMINFMVYLQYYLQSARLNHPETHATVRNNPTARAAIQTLWTQAENVLRSSYPLTLPGNSPRVDYSRPYFAAAYSPTLLAELDAIGVTHGTAATWANSYLR
jgi:hypothetical protein